MPIADRRSPRNTKSAVTDHTAASFSQHTRSSTVGQVCRTVLTTIERVIDISIYDLGAYSWVKGHQKGRWPTIHLDLPSYKISARSRKRCSRCATKFFSLWRWFLTPHGHPRSNLTMPIESPWVLRISAPGVQRCICHRFRNISSQNFDCSPFDLGRANHWATGHQKRRWPTIHVDLLSYKFQHDCANGLRDMRYQSFSLFGPWGANPWAKVHQRGDDLLDSEIYHPAKFRGSVSTYARYIRYQKSCGHIHTHTHTQTVNGMCG